MGRNMLWAVMLVSALAVGGCAAEVNTKCIAYANSVAENSHSALQLMGPCRTGTTAACDQVAATLKTFEDTGRSIGAGKPAAQ